VRVRVHLVPGDVPERSERRGWLGIAIDVLRATTTLSVALANGARRVVPLAEPSAALALRAADAQALACGERGGRMLPGFDLGNSPFEYAADRVAGRTLAFASTNGSKALVALEGSEARWLGAFVTATALLHALEHAPRVRMVCAGRLGAFALEDAACAGWLCAHLAARGATLDNAAARLVADLAPRDADEIRRVVESSAHARDLVALGPEYARDVAFCATLDALDHAFTLDAACA
jgi:2-phosphosulfolactate phosphatase